MIRFHRFLLLLCAVAVTACADASGPRAPAERVTSVTVTAPTGQLYAPWVGDTVELDLRALDAAGRGVAGVGLDVALSGQGSLSATSVRTDAAGEATVALVLGGSATVSASVPGREVAGSLEMAARGMTVFLPDTVLEVAGPGCLDDDAARITVGDTALYGSDGGWRLAIEDTAIATVTNVTGAGGTVGLLGRQVWGRAAGVTRLVLKQHHLADTVEVRVSARGGLLGEISGGEGAGGGPLVARAGEALSFGAALPAGCRADVLPAGSEIVVTSLDAAVVRVDSVQPTVIHRSPSGPPVWTGSTWVHLHAVAPGHARIVASSPLFRPDTTLVEVAPS